MDALLNVIEDMRLSLDNKMKCAGLLLDLKNFFDSVNYQILLKMLENFGIRGVALYWFKNHVSAREDKLLKFVTQYQINVKLNVEFLKVRFWDRCCLLIT